MPAVSDGLTRPASGQSSPPIHHPLCEPDEKFLNLNQRSSEALSTWTPGPMVVETEIF